MRFFGRPKLKDEEPVECPYRGLMPFSEEDEKFFFGRSADTKIILANLIASRLTVVYGPTGVGKSSVLRAGVVSALYRNIQSNLEQGLPPEMLPVYFNAWNQYPVNPTSGVMHAFEAAARRFALNASQLQTDGTNGSGATLCAAARLWCQAADGPMLLILDQFEEYFLYNTTGNKFENELVALLLNSDIKVNCIFSIREDELALLDKFKGKLPFLLDNILRVNYLDRTGGREAILRPIDALNQSIGEQKPHYRVEPELVDAVLDDIYAGKLIWSDEKEKGDPGKLEARELVSHREIADSIETSFLQIVMTKIWEKEIKSGSRDLRLATLKELKGAKNIAQSHVSDALSRMRARQRKVAYRCFRYLVTPSGTKIALNENDLADLTGMRRRNDRKDIAETLKTLTSVRLLRSVADKHEIYHDVLAIAILEWRRRYSNARRWRFWATTASTILVVLLFAIVYFAYKAKQETNTARQDARRFDAAKTVLKSGYDSLNAGQYKNALDQFMQAQNEIGYELPPYVWNTLCWKGALGGEAGTVTPACENAVAGAPDNVHYLDSRALDRALIGNRKGAIEDFTKVIESPDLPPGQKKERVAFLQSLKNGRNPFTPEVLEKLKDE